ncbi:MAG: Ppx/GppA family phosphatase [Pseudomonadota bacterium]
MDGQNEPTEQDWGPFGRPLFDKPSARALSRVGVVDVGSNSVRMVVFDGAARSPAYFYNEKIMCALGANMASTGRLNPEGRVRALAALKRFQSLAETMRTGPLTAVATAAVREAEDGPEFEAQVQRETGLKLNVIDGAEEARLSAQGVLLGWPGSYGLVCDMGGSSVELAEIRGGEVGACMSSKLGPLRLRDLEGGATARRTLIKETIAHMRETLGEQRDRLFLVGGSWRAIAKIDMLRRGYPLHVLHEYRMNQASVRATAQFIRDNSVDDLRRMANVSSARMALVPYAAEVLTRLVQTFKPRDIAISSYGVREGLLYEQMPQELRDRDPLIEACRFAEFKDARLPGYGKLIFDFVKPLFSKAKPDVVRLIKAACLLHDVSWRAHPDYRAEDCFDNATRANLGGLKHSERVFLGLALMHRYSNKRDGSRFETLSALVDDKQERDAEILGRAMRFAAMFWLRKDAKIGKLRWQPKKAVLTLTLNPSAVPLFGEVAQARFNALAQALGAEPKVEVTTKAG